MEFSRRVDSFFGLELRHEFQKSSRFPEKGIGYRLARSAEANRVRCTAWLGAPYGTAHRVEPRSLPVLVCSLWLDAATLMWV